MPSVNPVTDRSLDDSIAMSKPQQDRDRPRRRVLVVTYTFPPVGGAGVQRVTKFVKYLHRYGWQPTVLTVANPSVPAIDKSLETDIPPGTAVHVAKSREPGYAIKAQATGAENDGPARPSLKRRLIGLGGKAAKSVLQPDPQILWYPDAVATGSRVLRDGEFDAIFVTAPPFSAFLIAAKLAKRFKLPLVVDYRDEWTISNDYWENKKLGPVSGPLQERMQASVLRRASAVIATTKRSAESLQDACRNAKSDADVSWIYNGFDTDDFPSDDTATTEADCFRLAYTGTLWNLTSIKPVVEAIQRLSKESPDLAAKLKLVVAGRRIGEQAAVIDSLRDSACQLETHDYLPHADAIGLLRGADASCLLLSGVPGAERVVPAKLFEYMACRRPILAVLPEGESWKLLDDYSHVDRFEPQNVDGIVAWLTQSIQRKLDGTQGLLADPPHSKFTRENQAEQLATLLDSCATVG